MDMNLLLEAERRGILPDDKKALLLEARNRGLISGGDTPVPAPSPKNKPTLLENIGSDWANRLKTMEAASTELPGVNPRFPLRVAGETAGMGYDVLSRGIDALIPESVKEWGKAKIADLLKPQPGKRNLMEDISSIPKRLEGIYPGASKDVGAVANLAMLGPTKTVAGMGGTALKEGASVGLDLVGLAGRKTPEAINKEITGIVKENLGKAIRLAPQGKPTWAATEKYFEKSGSAIQDIVKNKENLELTNIVGDAVKNQLPETRIQMAQSIHDTKSQLFNEFNAKQVAAGKRGALVELEPIAKELDAVINNKTLLADADGRAIIEHAKLQQQYLREASSFTPEQAQEWITRANSKLSPAYAKGSFQDVSRAGVDESVASMMRKRLDSAIEGVGEKGYQDLKNRYGALTQLEKGANKASLAALSKASMPNFFDITSGTALLHGLLAMNPATITAAGFMEGINVVRRHFQNPDTYVKNMFLKTEKLMQKKGIATIPFKPKSKLLQPQAELPKNKWESVE